MSEILDSEDLSKLDDVDDIDHLIEELKKDHVISNAAIPAKSDPILTAENIEAFILEKASKLINSGLSSVEELQEIIQTGVNPAEISSYAEVINATNSAIETLNKINLQTKKTKTAILLKEMDHKNQQSLPFGGGNNNVFIATREDVIKNLLSQVPALMTKPAEIIDVEFSTKPETSIEIID